MNEIKPCIRCGGHMSWNDNEFESAYVCDDCHYFVEWDGTPEEFVEWWNTRPIEDALNARIAELEAERRWKDSNVELPKEDTDGNALLVICRYSGEWARAPFGIEFSDEFVRHYSHWMPLPKPPEVQE